MHYFELQKIDRTHCTVQVISVVEVYYVQTRVGYTLQLPHAEPLSNTRESKGLALLITIFHLLKHSFGLSAVGKGDESIASLVTTQ